MLKVGLKYCGGCNSRYDRNKAVALLQERFGDQVALLQAKEGEIYDFLLVVCGCERACASCRQYKTRHEPIFLCCEQHFAEGGLKLNGLERELRRQTDERTGGGQTHSIR